MESSEARSRFQIVLEMYAFKTLGKLPVDKIVLGHITKVLEPIWDTKRETASRVRGRIEMILDFAAVHGWRPKTDNPARWSGNLEHALSSGKRTVKHHAALDWRTIGNFMVELADVRNSVGALPLRLAILTAVRTSEALLARWNEIDLKAGTWIIPGERMKAGEEHRVPLSIESLAILREAAQLRQDSAPDGLVFPGTRPGRPLSENALLETLRTMGHREHDSARITVHGFRSCFSDWGNETGKPSDLMKISTGAQDRQQSGASLSARRPVRNRRRKLMEQWATHCTTPPPMPPITWWRCIAARPWRVPRHEQHSHRLFKCELG